MSARATLGLLAPAAMYGQLAIFTVSASTEVPVGATYDFGRVAQGDTKDVRFRVRNTSATVPLRISSATTSGGAFRMLDRRSLPFDIPPGDFQDLSVRFEAGPPASYTSSLIVNTTTVALLAVSVAAPALSAISDCILTGVHIDFGRVEIGRTRVCGFSARNLSTEPITISTIRISGAGFALSGAPTPLRIPPGGAAEFSLSFSASTKGAFSGALSVETRTYSLAAVVYEPPLPRPSLEFDPEPLQSAQQVRLSMRLPEPAVTAASGFVTLSLAPDNPLAGADPAVVFVATGTRTAPFSVRAGDTQATIGGQPAAAFQTGTTAGRLQITVAGVAQGIRGGDLTTTLAIPASPVGIDTATAGRRPGSLDVQIVGFDNTYSAGEMTFQFYDRAGSALGGSMRADFRGEFRSYFESARVGSVFRLLLTFPVTGDAASVGAVDVELRNASGQAAARRLAFAQ